jgi:Cu(I)/Ag(I) efflux system protein CusF
MNTPTRHALTLSALLLLAPVAMQASADDAKRPPETAAAAAASDMADGVVRKIDLDAGRITLRHGEIRNLDMPPMTMVFNVKDKTLLDRLKAGDKVKFRAVQEAGKYTVVDLQPVP